jgi:hypothetical protein
VESRTHNSKTKSKNRRQSGARLQPFAKFLKYGLRIFSPAAIIADEYPFASSSQGGLGAILRGTTKVDSDSETRLSHVFTARHEKLTLSQGQALQVNNIFRGVPKGEDVQLDIVGWDRT